MKKRNLILKVSSVVISLALIAAMAFCMTSCGKSGTVEDTSSPVSEVKAEETVLGTGATQFKFKVTDQSGKTENYLINTDKTVLGDALCEVGIISAEENESGFVTTVNGVTLDWNTDQAYWAFYVGDEYAQAGVNATEITADGEYSFVYTKG